MKRKNILWGFAILIAAMVCCWACSSCGNDKEKDEPQNPLLGAWEYIHNPQVAALLEQKILEELQQNNALTPENIQILTKVKDIVGTSEFVIQLNTDGSARLYAYATHGVGPFVTGTWLQTDKALLLSAADLTVAVTDIQTDGTTLRCKVGELPLIFNRVKT